MAIGIDAGELDFIKSRRSQLPALMKCLDTKLLFKVAAPKALSGSVWPTFYTGTQPGHHGIYQHLVWDARRMGLRRIGPEWCPCRPFWVDLEDIGRKVTVLDVPYSFPIFLKRGVEISDWATHGQTRPMNGNRPEVREFLKRFGRSPIGRETPIKKTPAQLSSTHRTIMASAHRKSDLIRALMREFEWDVFICTFGELHRGGHIFYDEADARATAESETRLFEIYRAVDRAISRILEGLDSQQTTVILFSLHGMTRDYGQGHLIKPLMDRLNRRFLESYMGRRSRVHRTGGLVGRLRSTVPSRVQYAAAEAAPDWIRQWVVEREIVGGIRWSQTPGFSLRTDIRAELRLNLVGRESMGLIVPESALHREYVSLLHRNLKGLIDAETGVDLVDEVVPIQALFSGERSHMLPDFAVNWRPAPLARRVSSPEVGGLQVPPAGARGGDHTDFGFVAVCPSQALSAQLSSHRLSKVDSISDIGRLCTWLDGLAAA